MMNVVASIVGGWVMTSSAKAVLPRSGAETEREYALKDAIAVVAAAAADIDALTTLLSYFTRLGDSETLRDFREVREHLLKSRALLSTQEGLRARLSQAATNLTRLIEVPELAPMQLTPQMQLTEPPPPLAAVVDPTSPAQGLGEMRKQTIVNAVFSEIESMLRTPG